MKNRHIFIPAVDVGEIVPFSIRKTDSVQESIQSQDGAKKALIAFIDKLEAQFGESIYYLGFDEIGGKFYERFMFEKGGFFEIMMEAPLAMNAHFTGQERANSFCEALKQTLREALPKDKVAQMFIDSIAVQSEQDDSLTYKKWETMKEIRDQ